MSVDDPGADALINECAEPEDQDHAGGRRISLLARALARSLVSGTIAGGPWRIQADGQGKPHFIDTSGEKGPALSMTHTGNLAAAAVCKGGDLGIDLERHRLRDHSALAAQAFGPNEQAAVARGGWSEFYRIWTLREAFAKATGRGLPQVMDRADRFAVDRLETVWTAELDGARWHFASSLVGPDHCLGVALRGATSTGHDGALQIAEAGRMHVITNPAAVFIKAATCERSGSARRLGVLPTPPRGAAWASGV